MEPICPPRSCALQQTQESKGVFCWPVEKMGGGDFKKNTQLKFNINLNIQLRARKESAASFVKAC